MDISRMFLHAAQVCPFSFFFLRMQTQSYVSETSRNDKQKLCKERIATGVSIRQLVSNRTDYISHLLY